MGKKRKRSPVRHVNKRLQKREDEATEVEQLKSQYATLDATSFTKFTELPLSSKTLKGLSEAGYADLTEIQREAIGVALKGRDVLGAAKTGSGKTLAFLVPLLECLYTRQWTRLDGLGVLVISPTRELALQIHEVLRKVGKYRDFSACLAFGGKFVREEKARITGTNIIVCTPGRLLQHMNETAHFETESLQMLVLDEADRLLDLGFEEALNAIIHNLPASRQTLLFSATQTKSVKELSRLSLYKPVYVSVHENAEFSTPTTLNQNYIVCEHEDKLNMLCSFIKNHLRSKVLVFLTTCKQTRFVHAAFKLMQPGTPLMALHGNMKPLKRLEVYQEFSRKQRAVLFATDVAARGLDFPVVHWVIQLDCPDDANTYIHRGGRTARFNNAGESLLVLTSSEEEAMMKQLKEKKVQMNKIEVNRTKLCSIREALKKLYARNIELQEFAQRAIVAYVKAIYYMKNKAVFDVFKINVTAMATEYGLAEAPKLRFLEKRRKEREEKLARNQDKLASRQAQTLKKLQLAGNVAVDVSSSEDDEQVDALSSEDDEQVVEMDDEFQQMFSKPDDMTKIKGDDGIHIDDEDGSLKAFDDIMSQKIRREKSHLIDKDDDSQKKSHLDSLALVKACQPVRESKKITSAFTGSFENCTWNINTYNIYCKMESRQDQRRYLEIKRQQRQELKRKLKGKDDQQSDNDTEEDESKSDDEELLKVIDSLPDPDKFYGKQSNSVD